MDYNEYLRLQKKYGAPKPSLNKPKEEGVLKSIIDFGKEAIKPAPSSQEFERQALPQYSQSKNPLLRAITAPGTAIARGAIKTGSRLFPGSLEVAKTLGESREVAKKGGIADRIESGELPPEVLKDFKTLEKSNMQVIGDVGKAVLEFYAPKAVTTTAAIGFKAPAKEAFKKGFMENAPLGLGYELFNMASEDEKMTLKEYATRLGVSTLTVGVLGGIVSGAVPVSKAVQNQVRQMLAIKNLDPDVLTRIASSRKVPVTPGADGTKIPVGTPKTRQTDYANKMGYEPYANPNELPVIEGGGKLNIKGQTMDELGTPQVFTSRQAPERYIPNSELPVIQFGKETPVKSDLPITDRSVPEPRRFAPPGMRYEPIQQTTKDIIQKGRQAPGLIKQVVRDAPPRATTTEQPRVVQDDFVDDITYEPIKTTSQQPSNAVADTAQAPVSKQIPTEQPVTKDAPQADPVFTKEADTIAKRINSSKNEFEPQTNKEQVSKIMQKDIEEIKDIAFGYRQSKDEVPAQAHYAYLENLADDMAKNGDTSLALEMQYSTIDSQAGQNLQALNIARSGNIVRVLKDVRLAKEKALPRTTKARKETEIRNIEKQIKEAIDKIDIAKIKPTKEMIEEIIRKITC